MKKILILIIGLIFTLNVYGCSKKTEQNTQNSSTSTSNMNSKRTTIGIRFDDNTLENSKNLCYLSRSENLEFKLNFSSMYNKIEKFSILLYLDYKQINFDVNDKKNISFYDIYTSEADQSFNIKVDLKQYTEGSHRLDVILLNQHVTLPNQTEIKTDESSKNLFYSYKIDYKKATDSSVKIEKNQLEQYEVINEKVPFTINLDRNQIEMGQRKNISNQIRVKANQEFFIPFAMSDILSSKEYALHFNLNNKQWKIDGKDYFTFNLNGQKSIFKKLKIRAPEYKGTYYGTFILSRDPFWEEGSPFNRFSDQYEIIVE